MDNKAYNLDDGVKEYFEFIIQGHKYKFKYLNTEEIEKMQEISKGEDSETAIMEFLYDFVTKEDEKAPDFKDIFKKMTVPQLRLFREMARTEFS